MSGKELLDILKGDYTVKKEFDRLEMILSDKIDKILFSDSVYQHYVDNLRYKFIFEIIKFVDGDFTLEELKSKLQEFLNNNGVEKVVSTNDKLSSIHSVVNVYDDHEDKSTITSVKPGYIIHQQDGTDKILQFEEVKINEAHYDNPIKLFTKNEE